MDSDKFLKAKERWAVLDSILDTLYATPHKLLQEELNGFIKENNVLKNNLDANSFIFNDITYQIENGSYTNARSPILSPKLRTRFKQYVVDARGVDAEMTTLTLYLRQVMMKSGTIETVKERIPERFHNDIEKIGTLDADSRKTYQEMAHVCENGGLTSLETSAFSSKDLEDDYIKESIALIKQRLTYNLLRVAA